MYLFRFCSAAVAVLALSLTATAAGHARHAAHQARRTSHHSSRAHPVRHAAVHHAVHHATTNKPTRRVRKTHAAARSKTSPTGRSTTVTNNHYTNRVYYRRPSHRHHHRFYGRYSYGSGSNRWRSSHYSRGYGYGRNRRHHAIRGIVEAVQGNAANGTLSVKLQRQSSSRFRYGTSRTGVSAGSSVHRYHVNGNTRYDLISGGSGSAARASFAALKPGESVVLLATPGSSQAVRTVEILGRRR